MTTPTATPESWAKLYVSPPPAPAACGPDDWYLFHFNEVDEAGGIFNRKTGEPRAMFRSQVGYALAICAECPLATRQWCDATVRAGQSGASIIAGGYVYAHGRRVWSLADERRRGAA